MSKLLRRRRVRCILIGKRSSVPILPIWVNSRASCPSLRPRVQSTSLSGPICSVKFFPREQIVKLGLVAFCAIALFGNVKFPGADVSDPGVLRAYPLNLSSVETLPFVLDHVRKTRIRRPLVHQDSASFAV